jgi:hypothetical protein
MNFDPLDPFAKKKAPGRSRDEILRKPARGGGAGVGRKAGADSATTVEKESDAELMQPEAVYNPPSTKTEVVTLCNPQWVEKDRFFNEKGTATVEGKLPPSLSHLTRVSFTLFASSPSGKPERIDAKEAHLTDGKASVALDLFQPSLKEPSGDLVKKCEYYFKAKHAKSDEVQSPDLSVSAPVQVKLEITSLTTLFAPSAEKCIAKYKVKEGKLKSGAKVTLSITDAAGKAVFTKTDLEITQADESTFEWDGKGTDGKFARPAQSPLKATVEITGDAKSRSDAQEAKIEIKEIRIAIAGMDGNKRIVVNTPNADVEVTASVYLKKSDGNGVLTEAPISMEFSYEDPSNNNVEKNSSFEYSLGSKLGKRGDPAAVFWKGATGYTTTSPDSFKGKCAVEAKTASGPELGLAKALFKPSVVGGDDYKITVKTFAVDGITELAKTASDTFTVWRKILFTQVYTMDGETYLDTATTHAEIGPALETTGATGAFVLYERGAVTTLASGLTSKYIGLYDSAAPGKQANWPADFSPAKLEPSPHLMEPTAAELADYASVDPMKQAVAKIAIEAKAQLWFNAIVADYGTRVSNWFAAAAVPGGNSLLAVQYYHPKLSNVGADGQTNFWPAGISINMANPGSGLNQPGHPDKRTWREVQGFNRGSISVIFKNYGTTARLQIICRHEIGHGTKSAFKRAEFGVGDHSGSGLMTPYGATNTFSNADAAKLRGEP